MIQEKLELMPETYFELMLLYYKYVLYAFR